MSFVRLRRIVALVSTVVALACVAALPAAARAGDSFTPVTVSPIAPPVTPVLGSDGRYHVVYELTLTNTKAAPATIRSVAVRAATGRRRVLAKYAGARLVDRLRTLFPAPADNAVIRPNEQRLLFIELSFARRSQVPRALVHTLRVRAAANPAARRPSPLSYTVARVAIGGRPVTLGPPLRGAGWTAANGCCGPGINHRGSFQSVNGGLFDAQRFAIDWVRIDDAGRFVQGDASDVRNYHAYGAEVHSVAAGRVVSTLSSLPEQTPGRLPDPGSITLRTVDGNHVVVHIGNGRYVFYAHMQQGSITVKPGQRVRRGQVLGRLGNSGNTSAPHLHIHVMDGPAVLGSNGLPFVIDRFALTGEVSKRAFDAAPALEGTFPVRPVSPPATLSRRLPLDLNVVAFP